MKIVDLLKVESIDLKAQPKDKAAALEHLITLMESGGNLLDKDEYRACVLRREEEGRHCHSACQDKCCKGTGTGSYAGKGRR